MQMKIIVCGDSAVYINKMYYPSPVVIEIKDEFKEIVKNYVKKKLIKVLDKDIIASDIKFEIVEDENQCQAITKSGVQCNRMAVKGKKYCFLPAHSKLEDEEL